MHAPATAALGASRRRLMTLVMTESLVVSLVAAVIGLVLAHFAGRWILDMLIADEDAPAYWINFQIDGRMALLMVAAAALTTLVAGVVPALPLTWYGAWLTLRTRTSSVRASTGASPAASSNDASTGASSRHAASRARSRRGRR